MGGRLLREWISKPLRSKDEIQQRYEVVRFFIETHPLRTGLSAILKTIIDVERILSRLSLGLGNARDVVAIAQTIRSMLEIKQRCSEATIPRLVQQYLNSITEDLEMVHETIVSTFVDTPPLSIREGGMIRDGVHSELTALREIVHGGKHWVSRLEQTEKEKTGIHSLKVRYNKVFGFYIEVSHANTHLIPEHYQRKQTLVNGERYTTPELKEYEIKILTAEEGLQTLEYQLFQETLKKILTYTKQIQQACSAVAAIDCLLSFSRTAIEERYIEPILQTNGECCIKNGRHPVVEKLLRDTQFVPNNVTLTKTQQLLIITGPNMAGKSVFIRQIAIIVLLAHIGSFVPASEAHISLIDRLFVRSGASDAITSGLSTFMVEMVETAYILGNATDNSLVIMDEIGRGTSTYDGISIAWAVAEYLVSGPEKPKTLFATHYHELQELEQRHPAKIKNYHMAVIEENRIPVFLHTLTQGGASASFGIAVGKLAGLPDIVIEQAETILQTLETHNVYTNHPSQKTSQKAPTLHPVIQQIQELSINDLTPLQALQTLAHLKQLSS
jgi:DNA mismatch repair protein MutS